MTADESNPWQTHSSELKYANSWIEVTEHQVTTPGGSDGIYGVVHYKHLALGVIPLDDNGWTWLVGQWRYPLNFYSWEIPEGGGDFNETPLAGAQRELREETGIEATNWTQILEMHLSNSVSDEHCFLFLATGLTHGEATPEDTERLALRHLPFADAYAMVLDGRITDSLSVAAILRLHILLTEPNPTLPSSL